MWNSEDYKKQEIESAKAQITICEAARHMLTNNDLAAEIHIAGIKIGVCENKWLRPAIEKHMKELRKFVDGKPNLYE